MQPHMGYIKMVDDGLTPFRNSYHLVTTFLSGHLNLKLTPEEEALRKTLIECTELREVLLSLCRNFACTARKLTSNE